jgi:hypothetical protein
MSLRSFFDGLAFNTDRDDELDLLPMSTPEKSFEREINQHIIDCLID